MIEDSICDCNDIHYTDHDNVPNKHISDQYIHPGDHIDKTGEKS